MFLPYSKASDLVEDKIAQWLSHPENTDQYENLANTHWTLVGTVVIEGKDRHGSQLRLVTSTPVILSGELTTYFD
jgi:hypothetical protein